LIFQKSLIKVFISLSSFKETIQANHSLSKSTSAQKGNFPCLKTYWWFSRQNKRNQLEGISLNRNLTAGSRGCLGASSGPEPPAGWAAAAGQISTAGKPPAPAEAPSCGPGRWRPSSAAAAVEAGRGGVSVLGKPPSRADPSSVPDPSSAAFPRGSSRFGEGNYPEPPGRWPASAGTCSHLCWWWQPVVLTTTSPAAGP